MQTLTVFLSGMALSLSLIMAIGPQNAHVLRMGLARQHLPLTVLVCILADATLVLGAVNGLAALGPMPVWLHLVLLSLGAAFLTAYGGRSMVRFLAGLKTIKKQPQDLAAGAAALPRLNRQQAVGSALAFSWLNPHAWVETTALVGAASLAYGHAAQTFGWGAVAASVLWFPTLGVAAYCLGRRLRSPQIWVWLDGVVALMMWGVALSLLLSISKL